MLKKNSNQEIKLMANSENFKERVIFIDKLSEKLGKRKTESIQNICCCKLYKKTQTLW